jgi:hypothetical protein
VIDLATVKTWIEGLDYEVTQQDKATLRLKPPLPEGAELPSFYVQLAENWLLLSILPLVPIEHVLPGSLLVRLLVETRDMPVAKFALGDSGEVVLCAELPTESLDRSEVADVVQRMVRYARAFRASL